jgi:predicted ATPase
MVIKAICISLLIVIFKFLYYREESGIVKHIKDLNIKGFRGLRNLELYELGKINIFVGGNNSGKTSVLEAVELLRSPLEIRNYVRVSRSRETPFARRGLSVLDSLQWLFPVEHANSNMEKKEIDLMSTIGNDKVEFVLGYEDRMVLKSNLEFEDGMVFNSNLEFNEVDEEFIDEEIRVFNMHAALTYGKESVNKKFSISERTDIYKPDKDIELIKTIFVTSVDHRVRILATRSVHEAIVSGDRPKIVDAIRLFDQNIEGIEILSPDGHFPILYISHAKLGLVPMTVFGDGLKRALTFASAIVRSENGVLLIDELETGIHSTALTQLFNWLVKACEEFNVQLIATTHSLEAIDAILEASQDNELVLYRIGKNENHSIAKRFSSKTMINLRNELGQDVR